MRYQLISAAWPGVPKHVRACLRHGEEQVVDAALVDAETRERVAEYPAHHRDAQRFPGEDQAELNVCGWFPRMEHPRSHPLLAPCADSQFTLWRLPRTSPGNH